MVFALPGEPGLAEVAGDFKIQFHDRQGDFYWWAPLVIKLHYFLYKSVLLLDYYFLGSFFFLFPCFMSCTYMYILFRNSRADFWHGKLEKNYCLDIHFHFPRPFQLAEYNNDGEQGKFESNWSWWFWQGEACYIDDSIHICLCLWRANINYLTRFATNSWYLFAHTY